MGPSNSDSSVTRPQEALTSAWVEAQMRVPAQSRAMPNVFNAGNVVKQLIWTRVRKKIDSGYVYRVYGVLEGSSRTTFAAAHVVQGEGGYGWLTGLFPRQRQPCGAGGC